MTSPNAVVQYEVSDIERMARAIAASKLFGIASPEQAIALCLIAQAEGRHPASAAQDYHIIQGKPSKKADAMLRDFLNAGGKVEWHKLDDTIADATFSHPNGGSVRITWDMARAKTAQLTTAMWSKYPRQMLRSRVVSEGVRTIYPMATSGMYVPEEVQEFSSDLPGVALRKSTHQPDVVEAVAEPVKRIRDGSDGNPKSSRQAKLAGDWEITKELDAITNTAELLAWRDRNNERIGKMPPQWFASFEAEIYEPKMDTLRKVVDDTKLSDADSAVLLKSLAAMLDRCETQPAIKEWVHDKNNKASIRLLTEDDYMRFEDAYQARMDAVPNILAAG